MLIEHFRRKKLAQSEAKVEQQRDQIDSRKAQNYGFASMAAVEYAHVVASQLHNKDPKGAVVQLAPNPKDIVRRSRLYLCYCWE
jgi:hypothetical protein